MATSTSVPTAFSYAQAAKGRVSATNSQPPSSKVTSGTSTPATGTFSELSPGAQWADDVEGTVEAKTPTLSKSAPEQQVEESISSPSAVEIAAAELPPKKLAENSAAEPMPGSAHARPENEVKPTVNGSSPEPATESKSQSSDPAWIAERKERQNAAQGTDLPAKDEKKSKDSSHTQPAKQATLHDAPLPSINPWMKRAEESKVRTASQPSAALVPVPVPVPTAAAPSTARTTDEQSKVETVSRQPDTTENASFTTDTTNVHAVNEEASSVSPPAPEAKKAPFSRTTPDGTASSSAKSHAPATSRLVIKDEVSWPTPDTVAEKDRKVVSDKERENDKPIEELTPTSTKPKKKEWTSMVVTPNIIFETQNFRGRENPRGGERGSRGALRGRGGGRGAALAGERAGRSKDTDSATQRSMSSSNDVESTVNNPRPTRNGSAHAATDRIKEHQPDRSSHVDRRPNGKKMPSPATRHPDDAINFTDARRTKSPKQVGEAEATSNREPRAPASASRNNAEKPAGDLEIPAARSTTTANRKDTRPVEEGREIPYHGSNRGAKRGGRGRGGSREFANGHQNAQPYANGQSMDLPGANSGLMSPASPSSLQGGRGNHSFPQHQQGRGGWSRGNNNRAPSLPIEGFYPRFASINPQSHLPQVQTSFYPGMYDYQGYPMSAMPYQPYLEQQYLLDMVSTQLEYYFCTDNLLKDLFLRKNMDSQGFVFLKVIANFNRIKQLTTDLDVIRTCCITSENIEIGVGEDGQERLRKREGWEQFVLPLEHRNEAARTEGAQQLRQPERPQLSSWNASPFRGLTNARPHRGDRRSYDASATGLNGFASPFPGFITGQESFEPTRNGDNDSRGRSAKSATFENGIPRSSVTDIPDEKDGEPDAFPDEQTPALTVVVKMNQQRAPYHTNASRTFSNGSIDSRSVFADGDRKPIDSTNGIPMEKNVNTNGNGTISRGASPSKDGNAETEISLFWMKDQNLPSEGLPTDVSLEPYTALRLKALDQRAHAATGTCPYDLDVLYQFWCHFLIRNFNSRMYNDFRHYANEDAKERHSFVGLQNLVKFFAQSLLSQNTVRDRLLRDYVELVNSEPAKLEGSAFKQLRSAWRNGALNLKNRKKLTEMVDTTLRDRLEA